MLPATVDLAWYHGDTNAQTFRLTDGTNPIDLSGATVACWAQNGSTPVVMAVTVGPDPGEITISPPVAGIDAGSYAYDLEVTDTGEIVTWIRGRLNVAQDITNA